MEHNDYLINSFSSSMIQYLNEVLIHKNYVSHCFRKYNVKNERDVEFSCLLKRDIDSSSEGEKSVSRTKSCITEEIIKLNWERVNDSDLTGYRLALYVRAVENCLRKAGYQVANGDTWHTRLRVTTKSEQHRQQEDDESERTIVCGPVLDLETGTKATEITTEQYHRLRLMDAERSGENRETSDQQLLQALADASVKLSLLHVKITQGVSLNFDSESREKREKGNKGATFVLYNISRLASIRRKYLQGVAEKLHGSLPAAEHVDFTVLTESEEWRLLFNYLLEYPALVKRCAEEIVDGKPAIHNICHFLFGLCSLFSVYYRRHRILLNPKDHLLPLFQARLALALSTEQVLENLLTLLNIKKVEEM